MSRLLPPATTTPGQVVLEALPVEPAGLKAEAQRRGVPAAATPHEARRQAGEAVATLVEALVQLVRRHAPDRAVLSAIGDDLETLLARQTAEI